MKDADLKAYKFIKKRLYHRCFPMKFVKRLGTSILKNIYSVAASEEMISSVKQFNRDTAQTIKRTFSINYDCPAEVLIWYVNLKNKTVQKI